MLHLLSDLYFRMEHFILEATASSPKIHLNPDNGMFEFSGRSIPENSLDLFGPVIKWLRSYIDNPRPTTTCKFNLEYFNTSSSKYFVEITRMLEEIKFKKNKSVRIFWYFEENDLDIKEAGEDLIALLKIPVHFVKVDESGNIIDTTIKAVNPISNEISGEIRTEIQSVIEEKELEISVMASISDRLQRKLNETNQKLQEQSEVILQINNDLTKKNEELQNTIDALTKAKAGQKATTIVLFIAIVLFLISEALESYIEFSLGAQLPVWILLLIKVSIALLLKPIEMLTESTLLARRQAKIKK